MGVHSFDKLGAKMGVHSFFWQRVRAVRHTKNMGAINGLPTYLHTVISNIIYLQLFEQLQNVLELILNIASKAQPIYET